MRMIEVWKILSIERTIQKMCFHGERNNFYAYLMHFCHFMGFGYQELTKISYFGNFALDEGCMVVKSWGSNRQFNLLQNEYHIGFVNIHFLHFRKLYDVYNELSMNVNNCSLNYMYNGQWVLQWFSLNIHWIGSLKVQWYITNIHW